MAKYKISVIIPIYNAQNTIRRSVDSVINQTLGFSNIELILYDDNSTDDTRKILKEYSDSYENIVLILSNENSGSPGKGRNEGIKRATADYIMFMDNDDAFEENMCETLYNEIIKEDTDIVSCNHKWVDGTSSGIVNYNFSEGKHEEGKITFLNNDTFYFIDYAPWNKIYKKSTIQENNLMYPSGLSEDLQFNFILLIYANKIVYLKDYNGYVRYIQKNSLSKAMSYEKANETMDVFFKVISTYKKNEINADLSYLFREVMNVPLNKFYIFGSLLEDKQKTKDLMYSIYIFEQEIDFEDSYLSIFSKIPNKLIMKKRFNLAISYYKSMNFFIKNPKIINFYLKIKGFFNGSINTKHD